MRNCGNCKYWKMKDTPSGWGNCSKLGIWPNNRIVVPDGGMEKGAQTQITFGCALWENEKPNGPFSIVVEVDPGRGTQEWRVKQGERLSPHLRTTKQAQAWCDFVNEAWSIKNIDDGDISPLYYTVGSFPWLDCLTDKELKAITRDIYFSLRSYLWRRGFINSQEAQ